MSLIKEELDIKEEIDVEPADLEPQELQELLEPRELLEPQELLDPQELPVPQELPEPQERGIECFSCEKILSKRHLLHWTKCEDPNCFKFMCSSCVSKNNKLKRGSRCPVCSGVYNKGKTSLWIKCIYCGFWSHKKCFYSCRCIIRNKLSGHRF